MPDQVASLRCAEGHGGGFARWLSHVADSFAPADIERTDADFNAAIRTFDHGGLRMSYVSASPHVLERAWRHVEANAERRFVLCLQLSGSGSSVLQDGHSVRLRKGDLTVYDTARPYTLVHEDDFTCIGVAIPSSLVSTTPRTLEALSARRMERSDPLTQVVERTIATYEHSIATLTPFAQGRLVRSVIDLFDTLCTHYGQQAGAISSDVRDIQFNEILDYIDAHLSDPDLDPAKIAAAHFMSLRKLQNLAAERDIRISSHIRQRRLERCRDDLVDPRCADIGIAEIGARWGLLHPPHFATLFRTAFGVTPSAFRRDSHRLPV